MKDYSKNNYESLIVLYQEAYDFKVDQLHEDIIEFSLDSTPIARLVYSEATGMIILNFRVEIKIVDAIQIFNFGASHFKKLALGEVYFVEPDGILRLGDDAYSSISISQVSAKAEAAEYRPKESVTAIISEPMFEATHGDAKHTFLKYISIIKARSGKLIS